MKPVPVELTPQRAKYLMKKTGVLLIRYYTRTFGEPTEFWYTACDCYQYANLSRHMRYQIRHAYKNCVVCLVDPSWLAVNGYECYAAAFTRYKNHNALSKASFEKNILRDIGGPFEFWAVLVQEKLVVYGKCVVGDDYAFTVVLKFHPDYLHFYSAYALMDTILRKYVTDRGMAVSNGFRSLAHDTNIQEFLCKFGFRKVYCDLKIAYHPIVGVVVRYLYPFRGVVDHVPDCYLVPRVKALLDQERIRRSFLGNPIAGPAEIEEPGEADYR